MSESVASHPNGRPADDGAVRRKVGLVNLLSEPAKLAYAETGFILGNVPPTTERFTNRTDLRMVETHLSDFGPARRCASTT